MFETRLSFEQPRAPATPAVPGVVILSTRRALSSIVWLLTRIPPAAARQYMSYADTGCNRCLESYIGLTRSNLTTFPTIPV